MSGDYNSYLEFSQNIVTTYTPGPEPPGPEPPEPPGPGPAPTPTPFPKGAIRVFDTSMNLLGMVDDYEYLQWVRNWYVPDTWQLYINRYKENASTLLSGRVIDDSGNWSYGGFIGITIGNTDHIGIIERIELPLDARGKVSEQYQISGRGIEGILSQRIAFDGTNESDGYDSQNVAGETAMRHYVDVNCITTGAARILTGLSLYSVDQERGSVVDYKARFQGLDEVLEDICRETGLSYKLYWSGSGLNFIFVVEEGVDRSDTVTLSTGFGNIEEFRFLNSILEMRNLLYVGDGVDAAARGVQEVYSLYTEPTGWARREQFIDARDLTTADQLVQRGREQLAVLGESVSLEVKYLENNSFVLGKDFDLGDTVTVVYPDIVTLVSRVISITQEISPERGLKRTLGIGKAYPDMRSIMKNLRRSTAAEVRK